MNDQPDKQPRKRRLKVYAATIHFSNSVKEALGTDGRQGRAFVAAYSQRQAAALMGLTMGDFRHSGGETGNEERVSAALVEPGQVFVETMFGQRGRPVRPDDKQRIRAAVSLERNRGLAAHQRSDLMFGDALLAAEQERKAEEKARTEERDRQRTERQERREQTSRAVQETLERIRPLLEELGISPQTVSTGTSGGYAAERVGVLMPAEAAETLVRLAIEASHIQDL